MLLRLGIVRMTPLGGPSTFLPSLLRRQGGGRLFGSTRPDSVHILAQIAAIQALFFILLTLPVSTVLALLDQPAAVTDFFTAAEFSFASLKGTFLLISLLLSSLTMPIVVFAVVERARKCLDHVATYYFLYLLCCAACGGFPTSRAWWASCAVGVAVCTFVSEWLCLRIELEDIHINKRARSVEAEPLGRPRQEI